MPTVIYEAINRKVRVVSDNFYFRVERRTYRGLVRVLSTRDRELACRVAAQEVA